MGAALAFLATPVAAAAWVSVHSAALSAAVFGAFLSTAPLLANEALERRWSEIATRGGGQSEAIATALKQILSAAAIGFVTGGALVHVQVRGERGVRRPSRASVG